MYINQYTNKNFLFFKIPVKILNKEPYKSKMTHTSIIAYMYILNRINLSRINKLFDSDGDIYIYYSISELQKDLNSSKATTIKSLKILSELNLIGYKEKIKGKIDKIYVTDIFDNDYKLVQKLDHSGINNRPVLVQNLYPNNIYNKNIDYKYIRKNSYINYEQRHYDNLDFLYENLKWEKR
jgi:predicted transcriptional regulator